jgi:hypothetical protein
MAFRLRAPRLGSFQDVQYDLDQIAGVLGDRSVRGIVSGAGAVLGGSGDFSVVRNGVGDYTVTFTPQFADVPSVDPVPRIGGAVLAHAVLGGSTAVTASAARVLIFDLAAANAAIDAEFHFHARGAR